MGQVLVGLNGPTSLPPLLLQIDYARLKNKRVVLGYEHNAAHVLRQLPRLCGRPRARALLAPLICLFTALSAARCSCKRARKSSKVDAIARFYRQRIDALLALEQPS